jgi:hypothetical protein
MELTFIMLHFTGYKCWVEQQQHKNYNSVIRQIKRKRHLKEKLKSLNKFEVLKKCGFNKYDAKYISDLVEYNEMLSYRQQHESKYEPVVREFKTRLIYSVHVLESQFQRVNGDPSAYFYSRKLQYDKMLKAIQPELQKTPFETLYSSSVARFDEKFFPEASSYNLEFILRLVNPMFFNMFTYIHAGGKKISPYYHYYQIDISVDKFNYFNQYTFK